MLLSHHPPTQYCRTYKILGIRLCARCVGIPLGMLVALLFDFIIPLPLLLILPLPTFINFLLQELEKMKSRNYLKTTLTIFLGIYLFEIVHYLIYGNYLLGFVLLAYLLGIEFIVAKILHQNGKLEPLIKVYEDGVYR